MISSDISKPPLRARVTATGSGLTRTVAVQVVNGAGGAQGVSEGGAGGVPCLGMFAVLVVVGTAETDGGAGAQVIAAPSAGNLIAALVANKSGIYFTDTSGKLAFDVTQGGAWTSRSVRATVLGPADGTDQMVV